VAEVKAILVAMDGSQYPDREVHHALDLLGAGTPSSERAAQFSRSGRAFVAKEQLDSYRHDEDMKAVASAVEIAKKASEPPKAHIGIGRHDEVIRDFVLGLSRRPYSPQIGSRMLQSRRRRKALYLLCAEEAILQSTGPSIASWTIKRAPT